MSEKQHDEKAKAEHELLNGPVWLRQGGQHEPDKLPKMTGPITLKDGTVIVPRDSVNHPPHYTSGPSCPHCGTTVECITITENMGFCLGNAVKYIWRHKSKGNELEDLKKARWYLDREIARMESE